MFFDYKVVVLGFWDDLESALKGLGAEGWELVSAHPATLRGWSLILKKIKRAS
jgi:hypothetical protein